MIRSVVKELRAAGIQCDLDSSSRVLSIHSGRRAVNLRYVEKRRPPRPSEIAHLRAPDLLVVPFVGEKAASHLQQAGWNWADDQGNWYIRTSSLLLQRRITNKPPAPSVSLPKRGPGLSLLRRLLEVTEPESATWLAQSVGLSQPRVSQLAHRLGTLGLARRSPRRQWLVDRERLLDWFLENYPGPGGHEYFYYSLEAPAHVETHLFHASLHSNIVISADIGADRIAALRAPTKTIAYTDDAIPLINGRWTQAEGWHDANIILIEPEDDSVFLKSTHSDLEALQSQYPLAHPTQIIWDLQRLGGDDRREHAETLKQWLLNQIEL